MLLNAARSTNTQQTDIFITDLNGPAIHLNLPLLLISKHNVRVDMSLEYGGSDSDGEEDEEGADEVPDRDRVKVSANELAEKLAKRKKGGRGGTPLDGQGSKGSRPSMA